MARNSNKTRERTDQYVTRATLFLRLKSSDSKARRVAWQEFHDRYAPVIAGFARHLGAKVDDVDDIIQDVMLGFFSCSPSFVYDPAKGRFRGYLKVCTLHALKKRLGQNVKFQGLPLEAIDPESVEVTARWDDHWQQQQLKRAIQTVAEKYRRNTTFQAFERHVINAEPVETVCQTLKMSPDSVYQAKSRVTAALRKCIVEMEEDEG